MRSDGSVDPESFYKPDLYSLIEDMKSGDADALSMCIRFFLTESEGIWHGRARAKIARNLKSFDLSRNDRSRIVEKIAERLVSGNFAEQFKDQLGLAVHLSPEQILKAADMGRRSDKPYIVRYCDWVYDRNSRMEQVEAERECSPTED